MSGLCLCPEYADRTVDQPAKFYICFFCEVKLENKLALQEHQERCDHRSAGMEFLRFPPCEEFNRSEKRTFLENFSLVSVGKAEMLSRRQRNVTVDVIVIDDSDDEDDESVQKSLPECVEYPKSPIKRKTNVRKRRRNGVTGASARKNAAKLLRIDVCSPLGLRVKTHLDSVPAICDDSIKIVSSFDQLELHCSGSADADRSTDWFVESVMDTRCRTIKPWLIVTYRPSRLRKFCHAYKFSKRQRTEFCRTYDTGLSARARRLKRSIKPLRVHLTRLPLASSERIDCASCDAENVEEHSYCNRVVHDSCQFATRQFGFVLDENTAEADSAKNLSSSNVGGNSTALEGSDKEANLVISIRRNGLSATGEWQVIERTHKVIMSGSTNNVATQSMSSHDSDSCPSPKRRRTVTDEANISEDLHPVTDIVSSCPADEFSIVSRQSPSPTKGEIHLSRDVITDDTDNRHTTVNKPSASTAMAAGASKESTTDSKTCHQRQNDAHSAAFRSDSERRVTERRSKFATCASSSVPTGISPAESKMLHSLWMAGDRLPSLSFLCDICKKKVDCYTHAKSIIYSHYATHGIFNITVMEDKLPDGRIDVKLVELPEPSVESLEQTSIMPTLGESARRATPAMVSRRTITETPCTSVCNVDPARPLDEPLSNRSQIARPLMSGTSHTDGTRAISSDLSAADSVDVFNIAQRRFANQQPSAAVSSDIVNYSPMTCSFVRSICSTDIRNTDRCLYNMPGLRQTANSNSGVPSHCLHSSNIPAYGCDKSATPTYSSSVMNPRSSTVRYPDDVSMMRKSYPPSNAAAEVMPVRSSLPCRRNGPPTLLNNGCFDSRQHTAMATSVTSTTSAATRQMPTANASDPLSAAMADTFLKCMQALLQQTMNDVPSSDQQQQSHPPTKTMCNDVICID
jgi:hypothetical protein